VKSLRHLTQTVHPAIQPDQPDPAQKFSTGYAIAIENHFRINQTLIKKFQSDFDFIFLTRLRSKFFNQILMKKFQPDFDFYFSTTLCIKNDHPVGKFRKKPDEPETFGAPDHRAKWCVPEPAYAMGVMNLVQMFRSLNLFVSGESLSHSLLLSPSAH